MTEYTHGNVLTIDITDEMKQSYIDYAMSVIASRALPDVRDGLKPVHRRILYTMREEGKTPDRPFRKSAGTVGDVLGRYHPHSDSAVYDALVRLAQDFSMRYPLIEGHGNFGSIDGDPPAAMRYTEARLAPIAMEMMRDLDKETVDFVDNFDQERKEPTVLPARFPNLLCNGASGIAVGMATNIPPHNLREVIDAVVALIDNPEATSQDLMKIVQGPDFPTGGLIVGRDGIRSAYEKGRGIITIRSRARIEEHSGNRMRIVVTEIPYQASKAKIIERIAQLVKDRKIEGITNLVDETDRQGLRIVIELARTANPNVVLNQLYKFAGLQQNFSIIMLALVNGEPKILGLRDALYHYLEHQKDVIVRRTRYELNKAEARAHILEGLRIALDHIDAVIALIRGSRTTAEARTGLMEQFSLTERQAQAILEMQLQRLTGLERDKIEEEYAELVKTIAYLRAVLQSEQMVLDIIRKEITEIRDRFGDDRRTQIIAGEGELDVEDLIADEDVVLTLTHQGYIKRTPLSTYRSQRRGGRGVTGVATRNEDFVSQLFITTNHHHLLFFTDRGRVYRCKVYEVPEASRAARGTAMVNLIEIDRDENVRYVLPLREFDGDACVLTATRRGIVKKTPLTEYANIRRGGLIAMTLDPGDELIGVHLTTGDTEVALATRRGLSIRFHEKDVRPMGRTARGVIGIRLDEGDQVVDMQPIGDNTHILTVSEKGYGKRTPIDEYRVQGRAGRGIKTFNVTDKTGKVVAFKGVQEGGDIMLVTHKGVLIRMEVSGIPAQGRATQGVRLIKLDEGDSVVAVAQAVSGEDQ
ncbi:MAG TPA: DNA gyrase subunit A [Sphingobacteriaceae bacterium]|nr:DNA gyrase subunit A [Sphingobacteriaceae bacterium]